MAPATVYRGRLVQQSHAVVDAAAGVELAVRVAAGDASVQLIAQLGPLDVSNGYGQEAVLELRTPIASAGAWQTDANGLFMMERARRSNTTGFFDGYVLVRWWSPRVTELLPGHRDGLAAYPPRARPR